MGILFKSPVQHIASSKVAVELGPSSSKGPHMDEIRYVQCRWPSAVSIFYSAASGQDVF